ncbi:MAG TPA: hypothetical protein VGU02_00255 [Gaiellaceae bacterium]|nr:hypothetical protein [Gaiellaceae bacterium]
MTVFNKVELAVVTDLAAEGSQEARDRLFGLLFKLAELIAIATDDSPRSVLEQAFCAAPLTDAWLEATNGVTLFDPRKRANR